MVKLEFTGGHSFFLFFLNHRSWIIVRTSCRPEAILRWISHVLMFYDLSKISYKSVCFICKLSYLQL